MQWQTIATVMTTAHPKDVEQTRSRGNIGLVPFALRRIDHPVRERFSRRLRGQRTAQKCEPPDFYPQE